MKLIILFVSFFMFLPIIAQKSAYIPVYLLDTNTVDGHQFSWSKTMQSPNFIVIWGDSAGLNPTQANDPNLAFDPVSVLDTMEAIYQFFLSTGFPQDIPGTNLHTYKIPIIMLNTFGPNGAVGWAFGGDVDGVIGAFWAHPLAMQDGHVAAHELTHSLQAQTVIDYRTANSLGAVWQNMGIFWETHANFMRNLMYPTDVSAWGMDLYGTEAWGQWKNTYENYHILFGIYEEDGLNIINSMWRQSFSHEYPIAAYKRLQNYTQDQLNDKLFKYARRMATMDFPGYNIGHYLRQNRAANWNDQISLIQTTYTILKQDTLNPTHFIAPMEIAPEEYGYNLIPLNPIVDSCAVIVKFKGHTEANAYAGWRYGFVTQYANGLISRYSEIYSSPEDIIGFSLLPSETQMYLVVMGTPSSITTDTTNDTWKGYPKHFRFPYELTITGAIPEGHQIPAQFRAQLKNSGHLHPNGGGWVDNSAMVSNSVFVAPHAMVLGSSNLSGNCSVKGTAMVMNAHVSGNVQIKDNALVLGGVLSDNAVISDMAFVENDTVFGSAHVHMRARVSNYKLHGNIEVGGDVLVYNTAGECDNGTYYRMTNYYQDNLLECDGRTASHPVNSDVNNPIIPFTSIQMSLPCNCSNYPACLSLAGVNEMGIAENGPRIYPNPTREFIYIEVPQLTSQGAEVRIFNVQGGLVESLNLDQSKAQFNIQYLPNGMYNVVILAPNFFWNTRLSVVH